MLITTKTWRDCIFWRYHLQELRSSSVQASCKLTKSWKQDSVRWINQKQSKLGLVGVWLDLTNMWLMVSVHLTAVKQEICANNCWTCLSVSLMKITMQIAMYFWWKIHVSLRWWRFHDKDLRSLSTASSMEGGRYITTQQPSSSREKVTNFEAQVWKRQWLF